MRECVGMTSAVQPKLWLFDFDTTLARLDPVVDWPTLRAEVRALLERAHAPRKVMRQSPPRALAMYEAYRAYLDRAPDARTARVLARISKLIEKFELAGVDRAQPLEGTLDLLRAISVRKLAAGIVTSNSSVTVKRWLSHYGVGLAIAFVVGRDSKLALKPASAMVKRALEVGGVRVGDAIFVGDSEDDLHAARRARIRFIGVASDNDRRDRLVAAGASEIYSSPAALAIHRNLAAARPLGGARAPSPRKKSIARKSGAV
jgi:phosphoglycolate phosphatase-like HAD superfamily hydrolase